MLDLKCPVGAALRQGFRLASEDCGQGRDAIAVTSPLVGARMAVPSPMMTDGSTRSPGRWTWAVVAAVWVGAVGLGLAGASYRAAWPGRAAVAPRSWPSETGLARTAGRPTLLLFVHTRCPCTRASLRELSRTMARAEGRIDVTILMSGPAKDDTAPFGGLDAVALARAVPGARVVVDSAEVGRFGVFTSGQVLLYDGDGALTFQGGITQARGHEGPSVGGEAILRVALREPPRIETSAVFGCGLPSPVEIARNGESP